MNVSSRSYGLNLGLTDSRPLTRNPLKAQIQGMTTKFTYGSPDLVAWACDSTAALSLPVSATEAPGLSPECFSFWGQTRSRQPSSCPGPDHSVGSASGQPCPPSLPSP